MPNINANPNTTTAQNLKNLIENVVNQYIVRPTGSPNLTGVSGFVFDIIGAEGVQIRSDITEHYVEENFAIQDHWAKKPEMVSVRGYVGEITDLFPNTLLSILTNIQSLSSIGGFLPTFASQATQVYAKIAGVVSKVGQVINQARNVYDIFTQNSTTANRQQNAFNYFYTLWQSRQLCDVETPFGVFTNMAIEDIQVEQSEQTKMISDFTVIFKKIRTVSTTTLIGILNNPDGSGKKTQTSPIASGRVADMISKTVAKGQTAGQGILSGGSLVTTDILKKAFV